MRSYLSLNNYVALHYSAKHLSWLHCFWGVGTLVGPYAMSYAISSSFGWRLGYIVVGILQIIILAIVLITFPLWKKAKIKGEENNEEVQFAKLTFKQKLSIKGVIFILIAFFAYYFINKILSIKDKKRSQISRCKFKKMDAKHPLNDSTSWSKK